MLKIGEFSKLSLLTVKTLRFYEREGLLVPAAVDPWTGYRHYETAQLQTAARIRSYRQLGLTVQQTRAVLDGADLEPMLRAKAAELQGARQDIEKRLSIINHLLKEGTMTYEISVKDIPACIVYTAQERLAAVADKMEFIPRCGAECLKLNPGLKCAEPPYEFCEYPDGEYRETDVLVRHSEAVVAKGVGSGFITFREIPACKVLSTLHLGPYETLGDAYAYIMKYAEDNGYSPAGLARECYIDGIWNKESSDEWLTEIQLPIE